MFKDRSAWMMLMTSILLGTAFLTDIRIVSNLSFANAISHFIINVIIIIYCFSQVLFFFVNKYYKFVFKD